MVVSFWKNGRILADAAKHDCTQEDIAVVTTTVGSPDAARKLARAILDARLAACVQIEPIAASFYRWQGRLREDAEVWFLFLFLLAQLAGLQRLFTDEHPYELPQCGVARCGASNAYAAWVRSEVAT